MDLLTSADLEMLMLPGDAGERVSVFLPTHRYGDDVQTDPLRFKNLLTSMASVLAARGVRRREIDELLAPAWDLHQDALPWQHMSDGLAVYLRRGWMRVFRVPVTLPEVATVGDRFVVGPLLRLLSGDEHFLLLALSQRKVRLFEGSRDRVEELELGEIPTSLLEITELTGPRSHTMARPLSGAGRGGPAVFYGYGTQEVSDKEEVQRFLRQVADGVGEYLGNRDLPMVLAGLTEALAMYREVDGYAHLLPEAVERNPDDLSAEELHEAAWPIVARSVAEKGRRALALLAELNGTGLASTDAGVIAEAADQGRVATLFLSGDATRCWEQSTPGSPNVVQLGTDERFARCELLDRLAAGTLVRGGEVYATVDSEPGGSGDVSAIFRY